MSHTEPNENLKQAERAIQGAEPPADAPAPTAPDPADALAAAEAKAQEMEDRWLRAAAEFENYRKRAAREREQAVARASDAELLAVARVIDDLERALGAAETDSATVESLREGLAFVLQHARACLTDRGVEVVDPLDAPFDPALHEAVLRNPEGPPNTVTRVLARGYRKDGRVLRPAQVEVGG